MSVKTCTICGETKEESLFEPRKLKSGLISTRNQCITCQNLRRNVSRDKRRDQVNAAERRRWIYLKDAANERRRLKYKNDSSYWVNSYLKKRIQKNINQKRSAGIMTTGRIIRIEVKKVAQIKELGI